MHSRRRLFLQTAVCLFAAAVFLPGINWGLPSRDVDPYLFGDRPVWTGQQILALTGGWGGDVDIGADVDRNPLERRDVPLVLNATDEQRAEIVQRYRIQSYQPDEHITFRALSRMRPGRLQLDPGLYQYGGLWVYPVGALLKVASVLGLVDVRADVAFYLDHPEAFGRFYIVARLYSAAWGVVGAWAVYRLTLKLAGHDGPAAVAAACWACMPVVVNMAHEAKPHLPGLALMLLAVLAACRYVETGATRWWLTAGAMCGAAFGMVISSLVVFAILPTMTLLRRQSWYRRALVAAGAGAVGAVVYTVTNPYVLINLVWDRELLRSNLGTSTAMYQASAGQGLLNALKLLAEGSRLIGAPGWVALIVLPRWRWGATRHPIWLLGVPAVIVLVQFVALAAGKPGEYGRFALLPNTALCLLAVSGTWLFFERRSRAIAITLACVLPTLATAWIYPIHFLADSRAPTTRAREAERIRQLLGGGARRLALAAEPAPYVLPPVDLWRWRLELMPRGRPAADAARATGADVFVRAVDAPGAHVPEGFRRLDLLSPRNSALGEPARISWAAKPLEVLVADPPVPPQPPQPPEPP